MVCVSNGFRGTAKAEVREVTMKKLACESRAPQASGFGSCASRGKRNQDFKLRETLRCNTRFCQVNSETPRILCLKPMAMYQWDLKTAVRETPREFGFPLHHAWSFTVPLVMPVQSGSRICILVLDLAGAWVTVSSSLLFSPGRLNRFARCNAARSVRCLNRLLRCW